MHFLPPLPRFPGPRRIADWYRNRKLDHSAGILPPVPTPGSVADTFREHPAARKTMLWIVLLMVIAAGCYFTGPRLWHKGKSWRSRQQAARAIAAMDRNDWPAATKMISSALQLDRMQPDAQRAYAKLLSRTGRAANAVEWWSRLSQSRPLSLDDRRDCLAAAISANEIGLAEEQIKLIRAGQKTLEPADLLLAGQLAVLRGNNSEGLEDAQTVLQNPSASRRDDLAANLLVLAASPRDSSSYVTACSHLVDVARRGNDAIALDALVILAKQLVAPPPGSPATELLSIPLPELSPQNMPALEIADRLEKHPESRPYHKMLALEMRARAQPNNEGALIDQALSTYGSEDDQTAAALGAWLYARGHFQEILTLLPIERASRSRELLVERIDALAASDQFDELKEMLLVTEYPVLPQTYQHMYLAMVHATLGKTTLASDEWRRALDAADNVDRLLALADFAQKNNRLEVVDEALGRAILKQPGLRSAYIRRLHALETIGPADQAHELALEMLGLWPADAETRMHEIYLRLLLTSPAADPDKAEEEAEQLYARMPPTALARSTLALARLKAGRPAAALETLGGADVNLTPKNISRPVYAAALAASGWKDKARNEAKRLITTPLLPEERALIAPLVDDGGRRH